MQLIFSLSLIHCSADFDLFGLLLDCFRDDNFQDTKVVASVNLLDIHFVTQLELKVQLARCQSDRLSRFQSMDICKQRAKRVAQRAEVERADGRVLRNYRFFLKFGSQISLIALDRRSLG